MVRERARPEHEHDPEVGARHGQDRAEQKLEEVHVERSGAGDEYDPGGDAGIEDEREGLVARSAAARAQPFDRQRPQHSRHEGRQHRGRCRAGSPRRPRRMPRARARRRPGRHRARRGRSRRRVQATRRLAPMANASGHELEVKHAYETGRATRLGDRRAARRRRSRRARARGGHTMCSTAPNSCRRTGS